MKSAIGKCRLACAGAILAVLGSPAAAPAQPAPAAGNATEAERVERVAAFERNGQSSDPAYLDALGSLALLYVNQGRYSDAVPVLRRALAASERINGAEHDLTQQIRVTLTLAERFANLR